MPYLSLYMYGISCYVNQRLCIKIQNEAPTTTSGARRTSKYAEFRCCRTLFVEGGVVVESYDDDLEGT